MDINFNAPYFILSAIKRIYHEFPELVGQNEWREIQPQVDSYITQMENEPNQIQSSVQVMGLLWQYPAAHQRLNDERKVQKLIGKKIINQLSVLAEEIDLLPEEIGMLLAFVYMNTRWEFDPTLLLDTDEEDSTLYMRHIYLSQGGLFGAQSFKFSNIQINIASFLTIAGGYLLAGQDMVEKKAPIFIAGALMVMMGTLGDRLKKDISQQEATVLWGFLQVAAHRVNRQATIQEIVENVNVEREKHFLEPLTEIQCQQSLLALTQFRTVEQIDAKMWRMIENITIAE